MIPALAAAPRGRGAGRRADDVARRHVRDRPRCPASRGAYVVTGDNVMGLHVTPAVGALLAGWIAGGERPGLLAPFGARPLRRTRRGRAARRRARAVRDEVPAPRRARAGVTTDPRERHLVRYLGGFAPFVVARAEGMWLETTDGRRLLDFSSGQICSTLGHRHPRVMAAAAAALDTRRPPRLADAVRAGAGAGGPARGAGAGAARARDAAVDGRRGERVRDQAREDAHRAIRGGRRRPGVPRRDHRRRQLHLPALAAGLRAARARHARDPGAVRLPLPDPPLSRDVRLHLRRRRLRAGRPAVGRVAGGADLRADPLVGGRDRAARRLARGGSPSTAGAATCC